VRLPPEVGALLRQAIGAAEETLYLQDHEAEQARSSILHNDDPASTDRFLVTVHVDQPLLQ
jgi:hypothetical protein